MKQNKIKYFRILLIAGLVFAMQSCLKNNDYYVDFSKGAPAVELPLAAVNANAPFAVSFDIVDTPTTYYAVINVASPDVPNTVTTATLGLDSAYLTQYNADQLANDPDYEPYDLLPDSTYTIASWDASIPAGTRELYLPIKLYTSKIDPGQIYVLPLTIVKASVAVSNWNHLMLNIGPKNQWDGNYKVSGEFFHPSYGDQVWDFSAGITQTLTTSGARSVYANPIKTPTVTFGIQLDITVNADNSLTEVLNGSTTPTPNNDHYDPDTKTFYVSGGYSTRWYKAVYTYIGPR